jgi:hypothetical protein
MLSNGHPGSSYIDPHARLPIYRHIVVSSLLGLKRSAKVLGPSMRTKDRGTAESGVGKVNDVK